MYVFSDLSESKNRPFVSVTKLEPRRNDLQYTGSKPKSSPPDQEPTLKDLADGPINQKTGLNTRGCLNHPKNFKTYEDSCRQCVSVFTSVKEAVQTLSREGLCETPLVCLENVLKSNTGHSKSVNIADVKKLMNHSKSDIQKQHQENFEAELRKRLQRKSPVENTYKDSSMEDTADRCLDVYCDTPVKQNPVTTGKGKAKGRKKPIDGQSPKASPVKQSTTENCVAGNVEASDGTNDHGAEEDKQVKGKKKGKGSPSKKSKVPVVDTLFGDYTNSTPKKLVTKKRKPKVKIDHGTPDFETSSTSFTPSPDSSNKKSSLKLSASGPCTPSVGNELHIRINHNDSAHSSASLSKDSSCLEPADSPSSLSPSKELGRRIRAPNMRYSDDILLLPLKSPRRSRSPKGSAEKEGFPGTPEDSPRESVSPEKGKKSDEGQSSQLYSLLTNKAQSNKVVIEKPVSDHKQSNIDTSLKEKDTSPQSSQSISKASPLTNGVVDGLETKSEKSSEKTKKKRKKKMDEGTAEAPKPKSTAKSEKKLKSPQKVKSPKSGAVRVLQFDENEKKTEKLLPEDKTVKPKAPGKGKKIATPKKPKKTTEKGKKAAAKSSPKVLESSSMSQSAYMSELSESRSGSVNTPTASAHSAESSASKSFNLFSLIAKVKDNMSSVTFPEFADEVLLIAEEEDTSKEDLSSENDPKEKRENAENNPESSEIVDDFFSADFLKVSPKRLPVLKSSSREAQNHEETNLNEESSSKQSLTKLENVQKKKNVPLDTVNDNTVTSSTSEGSPIRTKTLDGTTKKDDCIENSSLEISDEKMLEESTSSIDPTAPLMIDTQERRNIFDAIMTDYPSPNNLKENSESSEKVREKSEMDKISSDLQAHCDNKTISPTVNDNLSISLQGDKSIIEKIQVKLGIPVEECSEKHKSNSKCDSLTKQLETGRSPAKPIPLPVKKRVPSSALDEEKEHNSTKGSSDFEIVMDTVDDQPMEMDSDSTPSPPDERAGSGRPVPRMSTQRVTKEPAPLSVLSSIEAEVKDKMCAFTSTSLNKYLDTKTNRKVKLSRPVKLNDSEERLVEDSEDEMEEVTEMPEQYNEFSGMIEQCEPSFDEVDGVLFTSFSNEEALNAHVKVERKSKIGKNESILLGMARMRNLRERQNQIRNSVHQKKDARLKALKEQYKINQSLQGMHLVLMKYQRLFKRELILQLMAKEQESPGSIRGKTPKKTSDITQIKGWKHKFGADDDSLDMKANMGKLHWRTEERLLRNHDPEKLKQMGLELKKKRRKNLVFTIRKGMSKGDPSKVDKIELAAQADEEGNIMEGEVERLDGESSIGQELIEMGYEIIDTEKQKLRDKKQREKYKKYLMMKLKLNSEDIDILKKLGGQRLRSALKPESPKKLPPPRPPTSQGTEEGDKDGETTKDSTPESPSKKKRKRKKNYFNIITLNSSMANAAVSALHPKFVVKKKKAKAVKAIKQEPVDPDFDEKEKKEQIEDEVAGDRPEKKTEKKKDGDGQMKEVFDKMCDKPGMMLKKADTLSLLTTSFNSCCRFFFS